MRRTFNIAALLLTIIALSLSLCSSAQAGPLSWAKRQFREHPQRTAFVVAGASSVLVSRSALLLALPALVLPKPLEEGVARLYESLCGILFGTLHVAEANSATAHSTGICQRTVIIHLRRVFRYRGISQRTIRAGVRCVIENRTIFSVGA